MYTRNSILDRPITHIDSLLNVTRVNLSYTPSTMYHYPDDPTPAIFCFPLHLNMKQTISEITLYDKAVFRDWIECAFIDFQRSVAPRTAVIGLKEEALEGRNVSVAFIANQNNKIHPAFT